MTTTDTRPLTVHDTINLSTVVNAAIHGQRIARLVEGGHVVYGVARSIGDEHGNFARSSEDIRDCYLRVTTSTGFEVFWPVSELMQDVSTFTFIAPYEP